MCRRWKIFGKFPFCPSFWPFLIGRNFKIYKIYDFKQDFWQKYFPPNSGSPPRSNCKQIPFETIKNIPSYYRYRFYILFHKKLYADISHAWKWKEHVRTGSTACMLSHCCSVVLHILPYFASHFPFSGPTYLPTTTSRRPIFIPTFSHNLNSLSITKSP